MIPVVIGTHPERTDWLTDCLASIQATSSPKREIFVHGTGGYEPAAIRSGCSKFEQFLFLHDSVTVLHKDFWKVIDANGPAWLSGWPPMLMAIYKSADTEPHMPSHEVTKREAIEMESNLPSVLVMPTIWPDIRDSTHLRIEKRHGRSNMILGNHLWEKAKGNWGQG